MKKIKLITSLTALGTLATATPIVVTGCSKNEETKNDITVAATGTNCTYDASSKTLTVTDITAAADIILSVKDATGVSFTLGTAVTGYDIITGSTTAKDKLTIAKNTVTTTSTQSLTIKADGANDLTITVKAAAASIKVTGDGATVTLTDGTLDWSTTYTSGLTGLKFAIVNGQSTPTDWTCYDDYGNVITLTSSGNTSTLATKNTAAASDVSNLGKFIAQNIISKAGQKFTVQAWNSDTELAKFTFTVKGNVDYKISDVTQTTVPTLTKDTAMTTDVTLGTFKWTKADGTTPVTDRYSSGVKLSPEDGSGGLTQQNFFAPTSTSGTLTASIVKGSYGTGSYGTPKTAGTYYVTFACGDVTGTISCVFFSQFKYIVNSGS